MGGWKVIEVFDSRWLKQLKKKLKNKRRRWALMIGVSGCLLVCGFVVWSASDAMDRDRAVMAPYSSAEEKTVYLHKEYVCGEEKQLLGQLNEAEMDEIRQAHDDWEMMETKSGEIIFRQKVEALSPACKQFGFFGIDEEGNLSLFYGPPSDEQVMRTFFQIDIEYLESSLPQATVLQLYDGIPVRDLEEYESVLSTFSDYAVEVFPEEEL
ncbi:BofC C-terminal domain-containing protein [Marinicrinis sediminis]|uniref:BofC C-terminal domain-containing protein n=1 Tax=Marinicrinis sediminis TaxID=1652465 RepID=A0ABW5R798_9BACL